MGLVLQLILAGACLGARAHAADAVVARSTMTLSFDARIELLGVVRRLAGARDAGPAAAAYAAQADRWFGKYKNHPAVKAYRSAADRNGLTYGLLALFLSGPPELKWKYDTGLVPPGMLARAGGMDEYERFLEDLRDFAKVSRFSVFYDAHRADYGRFEASLYTAMGERDYVGELEAYVGPMHSRLTVIPSFLYGAGQPSYIIPYPYAGPGVRVSGPFEVFSIRTADDLLTSGGGFALGSFWSELLCVAVDSGLAVYGEKIGAYAGLLGEAAGAKECYGAPWVPECASYLISTAIFARLRAHDRPGSDAWPEVSPGKYGRMLAARLEEYEKHRDSYPTLMDFYPRLVDALGEADAARAGRRP
jgi:hypothetical protein